MERWLVSKENKKIGIIIAITFGIVFIELMEFIIFKNKLYNLSLEQSNIQIERVSEYIEKSFRLTLEHYQKELKVMEEQLEKDNNILSKRMLEEIESIVEFSDFLEIGISDLDGNIIDSTGSRYIKPNKVVKEMILNNKNYISNVIKDNNENLIFLAIPMKKDKKIIGSLWGKISIKKIIADIEFDKNSDRYFQIIDGEGNYILPSRNKNTFYNGSEIYKRTLWEELALYDYLDKDTPNKIYENIKNGKGGNFYFEKNKNGRYVNYRKLGINNWYIFSVLVKDNLQNYVEDIQGIVGRFFGGLIVGLFVIFGVIYNLIHSMYKKLEEQYHQTQNTNLMFSGILKETKDIPFVVDQKYKSVFFFGYPSQDSREEQSFEFLKPENMLANNKIDRENLENYLKFYNNAIVDGKACDPVVLYVSIGEKKRWVRIRFIENNNFQKKLVGVLEGYDEQIEKDLKIEDQLDNIKRIEEKSQIDFLTKVYNRESFIKKVNFEMERIKNSKVLYAFIIVDIDNFKNINDYLGHRIGDKVLQDIGQELQRSFRKEDIIGRLGGDEFVIFLKNIANVTSFEKRIKLLNKKLYREYEKDDVKIGISGSIGVVIENEYLPFNELYERADNALYRVKHSGRNGYNIYRE